LGRAPGETRGRFGAAGRRSRSAERRRRFTLYRSPPILSRRGPRRPVMGANRPDKR
jgi:hypothetical protein